MPWKLTIVQDETGQSVCKTEHQSGEEAKAAARGWREVMNGKDNPMLPATATIFDLDGHPWQRASATEEWGWGLMWRAARDPRVADLLAGEWDDPDELMGSLQADIRAGDLDLAAQLLAAVGDENEEPDRRGLALEAVAAIRVPGLGPEVAKAVRFALGSPDHDLRFTGVACASDLSRDEQAAVWPLIAQLAAGDDRSVARAARAFLEHRS